MFPPKHRTALCRCVAGAALVALLGAIGAARAADQPSRFSDEQITFFETKVRPVLAAHCFQCHGPQKQEAGLRLDSRAAVLRGADEGPVVVAGQPQKSRLLAAIRGEGDLQMPPDESLAAEAVAAFEQWIQWRLPWPDEIAGQPGHVSAWQTHWAFQPIADPPLPPVRDPHWPRGELDHFILARLEQVGLAPSPPADRRTLIRRMYFDMLGLPPPPDEVQALLADPRPDAEVLDALIDRLLASPQYGQRWGRYWLDLARYSDTKGYVFFEDGQYPWAYTYRDYVVRAFNADLPYDRFILEQLAADQLPGEDRASLAAMGFLTIGGRFMNNEHDILDDRIDVVARGLLGLTVTCARCHDHKYDPIPQADYYSLYGVFNSSYEPLVPPLLEPPPDSDQYRQYAAELEARHAKLNDFIQQKYQELVAGARRKAGQYLLAAEQARNLPSTEEFMLIADGGDLNPTMILRWRIFLERTQRHDDPVFRPWHALAGLPPDQFAARAPQVLEELAAADDPAKVNPLVLARLREAPPANLADMAALYGKLLEEIDTQWQTMLSQSGIDQPAAMPDTAAEQLRQVLYADDAPPNFPLRADLTFLKLLPDRASQDVLKNLLKAVEQQRVAPPAPPRGMVLFDLPQPVEPRIFLRGNPDRLGPQVPRQFLKILAGPQRQPFTQGSGRLELARAIADPRNPLTARVLVNRVWMYHFNQPLVGTPSDFGLRSDPPTHPLLLDHLASRFLRDGWSLKTLHRRILRSATYQQASADRPDGRHLDPENRLLWRANRRRLDFEALRDSVLAAAGLLDPALGGPSFDLLAFPPVPRRAVYGRIDRLAPPNLLSTFDIPSPDTTSPRRNQAIVPQQALFLMNNPFTRHAAEHLLRRPEVAAAADAPASIQQLYRICFARPPSTEETQLAQQFLGPEPIAPDTWTALAQALLLTNEFWMID